MLPIKNLTILILFCWQLAFAQNEKTAILLPIDNLFKALESGDSALMHASFFTDVTLLSVLEKEGKFNLRKESLQAFLNAVGTNHSESWHEPIWDLKVQQNGNFAQLWAKYAFYVGTKFSHCGVDTFQLVKTQTGWKIFYLADTRSKIGCKIPSKISKRYTQSK